MLSPPPCITQHQFENQGEPPEALPRRLQWLTPSSAAEETELRGGELPFNSVSFDHHRPMRWLGTGCGSWLRRGSGVRTLRALDSLRSSLFVTSSKQLKPQFHGQLAPAARQPPRHLGKHSVHSLGGSGEDTIFALATVPGRSGVAIIRISGIGARCPYFRSCTKR